MKGEKTGGRKKGTPNKATAFTREVITSVLGDYIETGMLGEDFKKLAAKDRVDAVIKLAGFILPKPQSIDMNVSANVHHAAIDEILAKLAKDND